MSMRESICLSKNNNHRCTPTLPQFYDSIFFNEFRKLPQQNNNVYVLCTKTQDPGVTLPLPSLVLNEFQVHQQIKPYITTFTQLFKWFAENIVVKVNCYLGYPFYFPVNHRTVPVWRVKRGHIREEPKKEVTRVGLRTRNWKVKRRCP